MTATKQTRANRRNAQKSTGPSSIAGKKASSKNALRHGLLSEEPLLPGERQTDWDGFRVALIESLDPEGPLEQYLAGQVASAAWKLTQRFSKAEAGIVLDQIHEIEARRATAGLSKYGRLVTFSEQRGCPSFKEYYEVHDEEGYAAAEKKQLDAKSKQVEEIPTLGRAFGEVEKKLINLTRYRSGIERSLFRNLHELQRLRATRQGESVPPPAVLDVDVSVVEACGN